MVAGKYYYCQPDVSCNNKNMWMRMLYVFTVFPNAKKKAGLQANESWSQNILIVIVLIKANFSALLVSAARHISFLNCTYSNGEVIGFK